MTESAKRPVPAKELSSTAEVTENVIDTYQICAEWIRFADAKAAVVLTVNGALASVVIPKLTPLVLHQSIKSPIIQLFLFLSATLFLCWGVSSLISCVNAFRCIIPYRIKGKHPAADQSPHFHSVGISSRFGTEEATAFQESFHALDGEAFQDEILASLLVDSHISKHKYERVGRSIISLAFAAAFGFAFMIVGQVLSMG